MKLATFSPEYLPALEYFWNMAQCEYVVLTDHLQYTKRSTVSISAPLNKPDDCLRIPIAHDRTTKPISEKKISTPGNWAKKHFNTIYHQYHHFPYAYYYLPIIEEFFIQPRSEIGHHLQIMTEKFASLLHLNVQIRASSRMEHNLDNESLISKWCVSEGVTTYISKPDIFAKGWLNNEIIQQNGIACRTFKPFPSAHIFTSFQSLSILSFLFQFGPEAGYLIRQYMPEDE